jgi:hypothetical protein
VLHHGGGGAPIAVRQGLSVSSTVRAECRAVCTARARLVYVSCAAAILFQKIRQQKRFLCISECLPFCVWHTKIRFKNNKQKTTDYSDFVYWNCDIKDKIKYRLDNIPVNWGQLLLLVFPPPRKTVSRIYIIFIYLLDTPRNQLFPKHTNTQSLSDHFFRREIKTPVVCVSLCEFQNLFQVFLFKWFVLWVCV